MRALGLGLGLRLGLGFRFGFGFGFGFGLGVASPSPNLLLQGRDRLGARVQLLTHLLCLPEQLALHRLDLTAHTALELALALRQLPPLLRRLAALLGA